METFVKVGDRVNVYDRPATSERWEGVGVVKNINSRISDMESAFVEVVFEGSPTVWPRWVYPSHVLSD